MSVRNILFSIIISIFLIGPACLYLVQVSDTISLPSWLTAKDADYLSGDLTKIKESSSIEIDFEDIKSGNFRNKIEDEVGHHIPLKGAALLSMASIQRSFIDASNLLFAWEGTPTFYGSEVLADSKDGRLFRIAEQVYPYTYSYIENARNTYDRFAERHPASDVYIYLPTSSTKSSANPSLSLMSNPLTYESIESIFNDGNEHSYHWISGSVSVDEFLEGWFKTDHHWNMIGALDAYEKIVGAMGSEAVKLEPSELIDFEEPRFYGSMARSGLDDSYSDSIIECIFDQFPDLKVKYDGEEAGSNTLANIPLYQSGNWDKNRFANRYGEIYHRDSGMIEIYNEASSNDSSILMVTDSYSNCIDRLIAAQYKNTYIMDLRHSDESPDAFLEKHPYIEDVLILQTQLLTGDSVKGFMGQ